MTQHSDIVPITFVVSGQRTDGVSRAGSASAELAAPPLGLGGTLRASVRIGAARGAAAVAATHRLEARPGHDVVVLHLVNGPSLVLHPSTAQALLNAQIAGAAREAASNQAGVVEVPTQLGWPGLAALAPAAQRGVTRGWLGDVVLAGIDLVANPLKDGAEDWVTGQLVQRIDAQVDEGVYALQSAALLPLKGQAPLPRLPEAHGAPLLVFVHGTFSTTASGFDKLWTQHPQRVRALFRHYDDRVFALDHATLGVSPIDNALTLVRACPPGTRLHLVTHSRGGLVGEVLARAGAAKRLDEAELAPFTAPQRAALRELVERMTRDDIRVERVVRVACPARGTLLASRRLDAYLSVLKWALDLAGVPVAPALLDFIGGVAQHRHDPNRIPGIEAMVPDSSLVQWLHASDVAVPGDLRVVAGDLSGDSISAWLKTLVADAYYRTDNDLVVHTASMYGGVPRAGGASFVFDTGARVTHFAYFANERTAVAVTDGLMHDVPPGYRPIGPLSQAGEASSGERGAARAARATASGLPASARPAVLVLPGILGSNLKVDGQRIWLGWRLVAGLQRLAYHPDGRGPRVEPDGPVGLSYDDLMDHLADTHEVIEFAYDWRLPIEREARRLARAVEAALDARTQSGQPVRLLAHSMGGLVARTMQLEAPQTWERLMARPGARLLMLGTPNQGSWAPMQCLSGDDTFGNALVAFGAPFSGHKARTMMAQFPGFLQLQAGLSDEARRLDRSETWQRLADDDLARTRRHNLWHDSDQQMAEMTWGVPTQAVLDAAVALRQRLDAQRTQALPRFADKLVLVVGHAAFTPNGYELGDDGLVYLDTPEAGDGRVPLDGALLPGVATWRLDCDHGKLPDRRDAFVAYVELLETGRTGRLAPLPAAAGRGASVPADLRRGRPGRRKQAAVPPESAQALWSLGVVETDCVVPAAAAQLHVSVHNIDLKFVREPLLVGHYSSPRLTGTERVIDTLIGHTMSESLAMGQYPDATGTHQLFVNCDGQVDHLLALPRPESVVVVGLGEEGKLCPGDLAHSVRLAVLALAQRRVESTGATPAPFDLAATLMGSGGVGITAGQSAQWVARGVRDADQAIADTNARLQAQGSARCWPRVGRLHLVELYLSRAGEAWSALRALGEGGHGAYAVDDTVHIGMGSLRRPLDGGYRGTDNDLISAIAARGPAGDERIVYTADSKRARSEVRAQAAQAGLVRELVRQAATDRNADAQLGRTLFRLLVPVELEPALGSSAELLLELDEGTAGIPWELLDTRAGTHGADGDPRPWAVRTRLLRKLRMQDYRLRPADAGVEARVLVIGEPACDSHQYAALPGARAEARAVVERLTAPGALGTDCVTALIGSDDGHARPGALEVINALMADDWRIVHIAGHGEPPLRQPPRSNDPNEPPGSILNPRGVVLSNNTFLGPREIESLRCVPELVFINCCHLAAREASEVLADPVGRSFDRAGFAASVAESLIRIGVRCVVAAGWAVGDEQAAAFATTFYDALLRGQRFVDAVAAAREAAHALGGNTWGAYQCYGDPQWVLRGMGCEAAGPVEDLASEFVDVATPPALALALETLAVQSRYQQRERQGQCARVRYLEARFGAFWGDIGAVAEAFGVAWEAAAEREPAIAWYTRAAAAGDGSASLKAVEQLASLRVRQAWGEVAKLAPPIAHLRRKAGRQRVAHTDPVARDRLSVAAQLAREAIGQALVPLDRLIALQPTLERHALRGAAAKRLVMIARLLDDTVGENDALSQMAGEYAAAHACGQRQGAANLFYPLANRLAAEVAQRAGTPGWGGLDTAALAELQRGLEACAAKVPDFWAVVGLSELRLLRGLQARDLAAVQPTLALEYANLQSRVTLTSCWESVLDQTRFLLHGYLERVRVPAEQRAAQALVTQLAAFARG